MAGRIIHGDCDDKAWEASRRTRCVNSGQPCQCERGSVAEAHCLNDRETARARLHDAATRLLEAFDAEWPKGGERGKPPFGLWVAVQNLCERLGSSEC